MGRPEIACDGARVEEFSTKKVFALFSFLVLNPRPHARGRLAGLLWGTSPPKNARRSLRVALSDLRKKAAGLISANRNTVEFSPAADAFVDVNAFRELTNQEGGQGTDQLKKGLGYIRGKLLAGVAVDGTAGFREWLMLEREHLRQQVIRALHSLSRRHLRNGNPLAAEVQLRRLVRLNPLEETAQRRLMRALSLQGRYTAALAHYEDFREILDLEMDLEPSRRTRQLRDRILARRHRPPQAPPGIPERPNGQEDASAP